MQEFNEFFANAQSATEGLTESEKEFLSSFTVFVISLALLPEAAAATSVLAALLAVGGVLGAGTSLATGLVLGMDVLGVIHLHESEFNSVKLTNALAGNLFTVLGGALGFSIDGEYGMETGITAGQFTGILFDGSDTVKGVMELAETKNFEGASLHLAQLVKEMQELPTSPSGEHVRAGQHFLAINPNADSITKDMIYQNARIPKPITNLVTDRPAARPAEDNAQRQIKLDRTLFGKPAEPASPFPWPPAPVGPTPLPPPPPPRTPVSPTPFPPSPTPTPTPAPTQPTPTSTPGFAPNFPDNLVPNYLGGSEPSETPPEVPSIPDQNEPGPQIPGPA